MGNYDIKARRIGDAALGRQQFQVARRDARGHPVGRAAGLGDVDRYVSTGDLLRDLIRRVGG